MAGDWIKMRTDLYRDPKVILIADHLMDPDGELSRYVSQLQQCDMSVTRNVTRNAVVGALVAVWGVARHQGKRVGDDLVIQNSQADVLDDISDLPGFGAAMVASGWCEESAQGLCFPRFFEEHNTDPLAKKRERDRERQRRYREAKAVTRQQRDASRDSHVTVTHREEREKSREESVSDDTQERAVTTTEMQAVVDEWNMLGITACSKLTSKRRTALGVRLRDPDWRATWKSAIDRVRGSPFCHGESESGWKADFDWFIRPDTVTRILEGKYDKRDGTQVGRGNHRESSAETRQRGNLTAIEGFLRRSGVREGDAGADGAEEDRRLH